MVSPVANCSSMEYYSLVFYTSCTVGMEQSITSLYDNCKLVFQLLRSYHFQSNSFHQCAALAQLTVAVQVSMKTEVTWVRDMLRGDDAYEMRVKLTRQVPEEYPYKDDE